MQGADDWRWRSGACIDRDSAGPWSDHRKPAWRRPPSLDGTVVAEIDGTALGQPTLRLVRRSVVAGGDGGASEQRGTCRGIRDQELSPAGRTDRGDISSGCGLETGRPLEWRSERADGAAGSVPKCEEC